MVESIVEAGTSTMFSRTSVTMKVSGGWEDVSMSDAAFDIRSRQRPKGPVIPTMLLGNVRSSVTTNQEP